MRAALAVVSLCGFAITGCGGGGGDGPSPPDNVAPAPAPVISAPPALPAPAPQPPAPTPAPPQTATPAGLYVGAASTGRTVTGLVLDDGAYYVLYSATNNPAVIAGAVQGTGVASNGAFTSANGRDINLEGLGVLSATVSASFVPTFSLSGGIVYPSLNQTLTFTSTYNRAYEIAPSLATIVGSYTGRAGSPLGAENATITISSSGAVTGRGSSGCTFSGNITPRAKGNAYDAAITFTGAPCLFPATMFTGVAYFDAVTKRIYAVGLKATRDTGFIFSGLKP